MGCVSKLGFYHLTPQFPLGHLTKIYLAHPRPPSLSPRAFDARYIMPLLSEKLPTKSPSKKMDTVG